MIKHNTEQKNAIVNNIEFSNLVRTRLLLYILLAIEVLFIILVDIPILTQRGGYFFWSDQRYFIIHCLLSFTAIAGIIIINPLLKNDSNKTKKLAGSVIRGLIIVVLSLVAILNGLEQLNLGQASSVFIANLLICNAVILIKFPLNLLIYLVPFLVFIGGLVFFQKDSALLYSNIINGTIFFAAVIFISKIMYDSQYAQISKTMMLEELNSKLDYLSKHDPLTGLSNRRYFEMQIKQKMDILQQSGGAAVLMLADIDCFKRINDQFGHPVGDVVLKEVSNVLLANIKNTDVVTRWGGEEFLIIFYQTSIIEAIEAAERIRQAIEKLNIVIDDSKFNVTISIGIAKIVTCADWFGAAYKLADKALYQAKNQGRNQVIEASHLEKDQNM